MDAAVEIISEDGDCPNPLFDSILNAMNSMKEATADKIYQKIQREGKNSYSKPQVDKALANALNYGIFEKRNNRYRVREDMANDEATTYWKLNRNRMQTPFRLLEGSHETQTGPKLNPEKDNKRFMNLKSSSKCFRCGRIKRPKTSPETWKKAPKSGFYDTTATVWAMSYPHLRSSSFDRSLNDLEARKNILLGKATYDSTDSEMDTLSTPTDEQSFKSYNVDASTKFRDPYKEPRCVLSSDYDYLEDYGYSKPKRRRSSDTLKSLTVTEKSDLSTTTNRTTPSGTDRNIPSTSKNVNKKGTSQCLASGGEICCNELMESNGHTFEEGMDWTPCSDEPQTAVIQTKNVLTIEPMDSLTFKSPDHTSYVS